MTYSLSLNVKKLLHDKLVDPNSERRALGKEWIYDRLPKLTSVEGPLIGVLQIPTTGKPIALGGGLYEAKETIELHIFINIGYTEGSDERHLTAREILNRIDGEVSDVFRDNLATIETWGCYRKPKWLGDAPSVVEDMVGLIVTYQFITQRLG